MNQGFVIGSIAMLCVSQPAFGASIPGQCNLPDEWKWESAFVVRPAAELYSFFDEISSLDSTLQAIAKEANPAKQELMRRDAERELANTGQNYMGGQEARSYESVEIIPERIVSSSGGSDEYLVVAKLIAGKDIDYPDLYLRADIETAATLTVGQSVSVCVANDRTSQGNPVKLKSAVEVFNSKNKNSSDVSAGINIEGDRFSIRRLYKSETDEFSWMPSHVTFKMSPGSL